MQDDYVWLDLLEESVNTYENYGFSFSACLIKI